MDNDNNNNNGMKIGLRLPQTDELRATKQNIEAKHSEVQIFLLYNLIDTN